ncbi:hypothetical protein VOLCADRAFT_86061 [Volvox carteri f. nagariensis]|uniref:DUF7963 domain-containing protein n=1 Tax=Volvox carteri f. nagariensis TaxID=3068 RepID=D8THR6_VOLCA|nr:uncharacterized protein VOLCADRAFT_86061 [Volvox carteri f. nagariensis]EFJ52761.1 hypothetical protein VOLCADRAFT_86061 [Volvox carteri f. nagariensis]|eukprot:XP_002945766.1 hypothetical protein VOLCADRAFT_86061 [Volvox carteri f. nagariensis]
MSDRGAGPSKPPLPHRKAEASGPMYKYGNKELDAKAYAEALISAKKKGLAAYWTSFNVLLIDGVVKLKCLTCGALLGAKNPTATAPLHLKRHERAASNAAEALQLSGAEDGEEESDMSGLKRSRSADGGSIRSFLANTIQIGVFLKNLALFFYTTNTALHLIENHYLVTACTAVGITLPNRKKLATTMLDEAHAELVTQIEKECEAGEGVACVIPLSEQTLPRQLCGDSVQVGT